MTAQRTSSMKLTLQEDGMVEVQYFGVGTEEVVMTELVPFSAFSPVMQEVITKSSKKKGV